MPGPNRQYSVRSRERPSFTRGLIYTQQQGRWDTGEPPRSLKTSLFLGFVYVFVLYVHSYLVLSYLDRHRRRRSTGFIRNSQAQDNIRRTIHIVEQAQKEKQNMLLLSVDAKKAFDSVNWKFLYKVIERLGFISKSVQCIKTLYHQPSARIKINGSLTNRINLQRSTRQGCCLSPTLFALFIEPLAQAVRQNEGIKGVIINGVAHKIGLFADDIMAYLSQPDDSLPTLMRLFEIYGHLSGYKINILKTQVLTLHYTPSRLIQESYNFNWKQKTIQYLGVCITKSKLNYIKQIIAILLGIFKKT